ncbi:hypothetical protein Micbo1qcDRAFT_167273 [Microdochium bolleyi]|uniref:DUF1275 domain protein n=1 Tax=Microdochium bolleyi TaxID=196109 RepID=A0A136IS00_9PEZI|nr:hypothetical protein Micbo1qcDRAFT_167273 [Microdochium bolleyi]
MAGQDPVLPLSTAGATTTTTPPPPQTTAATLEPPHTTTTTANASRATSISSQTAKQAQQEQQQEQPPSPTVNDHDVAAAAPTTSPRESFLSTLTHPVDRAYHADIPVCVCSFVSGLCDSVVFSASQVFVSMQTGNTVFLALGTAALPSHVPLMWLRALTSIGAFLAGAFVFGQLRRLGPTTKITLFANFLTQSLMIWTAAALATSGAVPALADLHYAEQLAIDGRIDLVVLAPIVLLAFQFGGQIVSSRQLGFNEVPTNVLTSVYCDLMSDPMLFSGLSENPKRNRRAAAVVLMFVGGVLGGWLGKAHEEMGMAIALWIGGGVKFVIAVGWLFWRTVPVVKRDSGDGVVAVGEKK